MWNFHEFFFREIENYKFIFTIFGWRRQWICRFAYVRARQYLHYFCNLQRHLWTLRMPYGTLGKFYFWTQKPCTDWVHGLHFLQIRIFESMPSIYFRSSSKRPKYNIYVPEISNGILFCKLWVLLNVTWKCKVWINKQLIHVLKMLSRIQNMYLV